MTPGWQYLFPAAFVLLVVVLLILHGLPRALVLTVTEVQVAALTLGAIVIIVLAFLALYFRRVGGQIKRR